MHPVRVLAYARVSSADQAQHGTSLEHQQEEARRYCAARGLSAPILFVEAESGAGTGEDRDVQTRLMADLRAGDLVLVAKQDRWSRDTRHFLASIDRILGAGARFVSIQEGFDPSTPEGRMVSTIMAAMAEQERARIRQRTLGARHRLRSLGFWVEGPPPFGYRVVARKLVIDEAQASIVRLTFALAIGGHTTREIVAWLSDQGHECDHAAVGRRIRDRRYLGEMPERGQRGRGARAGKVLHTHEAIVSVETFERAGLALSARRIGGRRGTDSRTSAFALRGLATCGDCGRALMSRAAMPDSSVRHGGWYVCAAGCVGNARHDALDALAYDAARERFAALAAAIGDNRPPPSKRLDVARDRERIETRRARLVEAITAGVLPHEAARAKLNELDAASAALDARESAVRVVPIAPEVRRAALSDVVGLERRWPLLAPEQRREVLGLLADAAAVSRAVAGRKWARTGHTLAMAWREIAAPSVGSCGAPRGGYLSGLRPWLGAA